MSLDSEISHCIFFTTDVVPWSTDPTASMRLLLQMNNIGWRVSIETGWNVHFYSGEIPGYNHTRADSPRTPCEICKKFREGRGSAETLPLAIAIAAMKATYGRNGR